MAYMTWEQRKAADAATPASDKLAHGGAIDELRAFEETFWSVFDDYDDSPHWISHEETGDEEGSYCYECAAAKIDELDEKAGRPRKEDDPDENGWWINGGSGESEDGPRSCETCGRTLRYFLDDYHAADELEHFTKQTEGPITTADEGYAITKLANWAKCLGPSQLTEVEEVVAIVRRIDADAVKAAAVIAVAEEVEKERISRKARLAREHANRTERRRLAA